MEHLLWLLLVFTGIHILNTVEQSKRIALLGRYLGRHHIESLLAQVTEGYLRALDTPDAQRREQIWAALDAAEAELVRQFSKFTEEFAGVFGAYTQVSKFPVAIPYATRVFPQASFDLRKLLAVHAHGIATVAANAAGHSRRDKAFTLTAELYLMQHTCHWFCKSKTVASARLLARHKTSYEQVLRAVSPATLRAYAQVTGMVESE